MINDHLSIDPPGLLLFFYEGFRGSCTVEVVGHNEEEMRECVVDQDEWCLDIWLCCNDTGNCFHTPEEHGGEVGEVPCWGLVHWIGEEEWYMIKDDVELVVNPEETCHEAPLVQGLNWECGDSEEEREPYEPWVRVCGGLGGKCQQMPLLRPTSPARPWNGGPLRLVLTAVVWDSEPRRAQGWLTLRNVCGTWCWKWWYNCNAERFDVGK